LHALILAYWPVEDDTLGCMIAGPFYNQLVSPVPVEVPLVLIRILPTDVPDVAADLLLFFSQAEFHELTPAYPSDRVSTYPNAGNLAYVFRPALGFQTPVL
jgi:hypothetical protein